MSTSQLLQDALELKYRAQIAEAKATLSIYFENSVGIGEHPQHLEEMDKLNCPTSGCTRINFRSILRSKTYLIIKTNQIILLIIK
jgi:hypothetical protein